MRLRIVAAALACLVSSGAAMAASPQFTADAVQSEPGQDLRSGKLFVGALGTRFEFQQHGQPVVQMVLPAKGIVRVLFPLERTYLEFKGDPAASGPISLPDVPCQPGPELECKREGGGKLSGIDVEIWTVKPKGASGRIRIWWDKSRKMPLRQEIPDGRVMQAVMRGPEQYEGRPVENWEITYLNPDGRYQRGMALFSRELGVAVVERQPDGKMRELRNIKIGAPAKALFEVPKGYSLIKPQPVSSPSNQAGANGGRSGRLRQGGRMMQPPQGMQNQVPASMRPRPRMDFNAGRPAAPGVSQAGRGGMPYQDPAMSGMQGRMPYPAQPGQPAGSGAGRWQGQPTYQGGMPYRFQPGQGGMAYPAPRGSMPQPYGRGGQRGRMPQTMAPGSMAGQRGMARGSFGTHGQPPANMQGWMMRPQPGAMMRPRTGGGSQ